MSATAENAMKNLLECVEAGTIPECYNGSMHEFMFDFWPDLPWDMEGCIRETEKLLEFPKLAVVQVFFITKYKFNFKAELQNAVAYFRREDF